MAYVYLDDGFAENPKILAITDAALRLYIGGLCYANRQLTDGRIPTQFVGRRHRTAEQLVKAGLWFTDDPSEGWWIHDYLKHQKSAARVHEERAKSAEKKRRQRASEDP